MAVIDDLVAQGAQLLVATEMHREPDSAPFLARVRSRYPVLWEDETSFILDLR